MKTLIAALVLLAGGAFALREPSARANFADASTSVPQDRTIAAGVESMIPVTNIKTCLWFETQAEEATRFYTSIFAGSKVLGEMRWGEGGFGPPGSIIAMDFELAGRPFMALNGAQGVAFNDSVSIAVDCASQVEIDALWEKLCDGGKPSQCGWLKDKFGVSWQIVPKELPALLTDKDPVKRKRVFDAMLQMSKLDLARLKQAHAGR